MSGIVRAVHQSSSKLGDTPLARLDLFESLPSRRFGCRASTTNSTAKSRSTSLYNGGAGSGAAGGSGCAGGGDGKKKPITGPAITAIGRASSMSCRRRRAYVHRFFSFFPLLSRCNAGSPSRAGCRALQLYSAPAGRGGGGDRELSGVEALGRSCGRARLAAAARREFFSCRCVCQSAPASSHRILFLTQGCRDPPCSQCLQTPLSLTRSWRSISLRTAGSSQSTKRASVVKWVDARL